MKIDRVVLIVLDSLGIGASPDATRFGDENANTLGNIAQWSKKNNKPFVLPNLERWGLGLLSPELAPASNQKPIAATARLRELSPGKDTTTGHWEMAGTPLEEEFPVFENGFSEELLYAWCKENALPGWLANKPASGTTILDEFGEEHIRTGKPIVYTSGDSVLQVAWSEEVFGIEKLYTLCKSARRMVDPLGVGRVIARPFVGLRRGLFKRTENRRDYSTPPPSPNMLDLLRENDRFVAGIGKIEDIFAHRSVNLVDHTGRNETTLAATLKMMKTTQGDSGLIFSNLIDFDQLHGHRRNPATYADALMDFDAWLPTLEGAAEESDLVILTADHGNDPTHKGTDHTREDVPLLIWSPHPSFRPKNFGLRMGLSSVARLTIESLGLGSNLDKVVGAARAPAMWGELA